MPIQLGGFGKAHSQSRPFGSFGRIIIVESHQKPKQTGPESFKK
jgi:hypothetical protein